ncbi:MAG: hypothetical protein Tsb009_06610 [Planctomycetaceae bacterium]
MRIDKEISEMTHQNGQSTSLKKVAPLRLTGASQIDADDSASSQPLGDVGDVCPPQEEQKEGSFIWRVERGAARNYRRLGERLAQAGDLYRNKEDGHGLIHVLPSGETRLVTKSSELGPIIVDRVRMRVVKEGKVVSELPSASHLNAMLRSEVFLKQFLPADEVTPTSFYLDDYTLAQPGYNDGGKGNRVLYLGSEPSFMDTTETIQRFLDVMAFATTADRTNAVAAALTVLLRRHWKGEKPLVLLTSTKSHSGKGTVTDFIRGSVPKADILYECIDWPMQSQFQKQIKMAPDVGMAVFDNVRLDSSGGRAKFIRSSFLESFVTSPEVFLSSPGAGEPLMIENRFVVTINTNDGALSPDLMNRSLPIHLAPNGDVHDRPTPIGNPKLEFLPKNRERIEAELRGMIERWKVEGCPHDESVKHPMSRWAKVVGGILKVNGFEEFLANYGTRKSADDPIREALSILGAAKPGKRLRPKEWAKLAVDQGLARTLFSPTERDTEKGRERAIGVILKRHLDVTLEAATDQMSYRLQLEGGFRRWERGKNPHTRYVFTVLEEAAKQVETD